MDGKRFVVCCLNLEILLWILLVFAVQLSDETDPGDVAAINNLYASLGSPSLPGWGAVGGDPCNGLWQGVVCENANIVTIRLNAANLGGELGDNLSSFSSLKTIDLSNNHIGGSIPSNLPVTLQNIFLSANAFTGSVPTSLSSLSQLSAMSLNGNHLTGEIPDSFQGLTALVNLDMSSNNLSGSLPPSVGNLSSLTTLHLQNNQLSGTLDVLQDLPLADLNVENNLFSGPIPQKLFSIPNFKKDGNPFNSSIAPLSPPTSSTAPPISGSPTSAQAPSSQSKPRKQGDGPSASAKSSSTGSKKSLSAKRVVWISIAAVFSFIILVLAILLYLPRCLRKWHEIQRTPKHHEVAPYMGARENPGAGGSLVQPGHDIEKAPLVVTPKENQPRRPAPIPKPQDEQQVTVQTMSAVPKKDNSEINLSRVDSDLMPPRPPPPPPSLPEERVIAKPIAAAEDTTMKLPTRPLPLTSVKYYTIASLQQYTNSFSQDNLLGSGMLGSVYRVELPNGKLLAVKKLDKRVCDQQKDDEFLDLVNNIDRIRHANVVELMGYCAEHGQRLLVYEYCRNGTLQDALHSDDEVKKLLSWNTRIRMALGAARALESVAIPLAANEKFRKDDGEKKANSSLYRSLIGSLLYLTSTRPDIMFAASLLSRFMQEPSQVHFGAAKHVLRYLQGTIDYGIMYKFDGDLNLVGYSDSDWAGSIDDMKSTSGYAFLFGSSICSWVSKKQSIVAQSTAEAEYVSTAKATSQAIWLRRILEDIGEKQKRGTVLYCDNKSAIAIAKNSVNHERSKHISIKYHFIREAQEKGEIQLHYCPTGEQLADIFTKALPREKFCYL